jgi:hypothetical protein
MTGCAEIRELTEKLALSEHLRKEAEEDLVKLSIDYVKLAWCGKGEP